MARILASTPLIRVLWLRGNSWDEMKFNLGLPTFCKEFLEAKNLQKVGNPLDKRDIFKSTPCWLWTGETIFFILSCQHPKPIWQYSRHQYEKIFTLSLVSIFFVRRCPAKKYGWAAPESKYAPPIFRTKSLAAAAMERYNFRKTIRTLDGFTGWW